MKSVVIIPTLHERDNLEKLIPAVFQHAPTAALLMVDDHSGDGTRELMADLQNRHPDLHFLERHEDRGYGRSVLAGLAWGHAPAYDRGITMGGGFFHDPKEIPALLSKLDAHDVVIGSRYVPDGGIKNWKWYRRFLSWFAQRYVRAILGTHFHDSTTGFVGYGSKALAHLVAHGPESEGYSFLLECKHMLQRSGHLIVEHPIIYADRHEGESKMSWKNIWESVWLPWRLRFGRMKK